TVKRIFLKRNGVFGRKSFFIEVCKSFAQETCTSTSTVINGFANLWVYHFYNRSNQRTRCVVFPTVSPCVAHIFDFVFVQVAHFVFLCVSTKTQFINTVYYFTQIVTALYAVF